MTNDKLLEVGNDNFSKLKQLYENNAKIIPFVGAGPSVTPGLPNWKGLLTGMINDFEDLKLSDFQELLDSYEFTKVASLIFSKINKEQYKEYLSNALKPQYAEFTSIHTSLVKRFEVILTTNFDGMFDEAAKEEGLEVNKQILPHFILSELFLSRTYVYLHGHIETGNLIFREEDYALFYDETNDFGYSSVIYDLMKLFIKETHLLFIGFSFADKDFTDMYSKIKNVELVESRKKVETHYSIEQDGQKEHFVFIGLNGDTDLNIKEYDKFKSLKILPIFYDVNQHSEISKHIRKLSQSGITVVKNEIGSEVLDG